MGKLTILILSSLLVNPAFAEAVDTSNINTASPDSSVRHPAANKETKTDVRPKDDVYRNPTSTGNSQRLNKKTTQGKVGNGVIDENAPGGMGAPEVKNKKNDPRTE